MKLKWLYFLLKSLIYSIFKCSEADFVEGDYDDTVKNCSSGEETLITINYTALIIYKVCVSCLLGRDGDEQFIVDN